MDHIIKTILVVSIALPIAIIGWRFYPSVPLSPVACGSQIQGHRDGEKWAYYDDIRHKAARRIGRTVDNLPCWGNCK